MDKGAWWATVHGVTKESDTTEQLNNSISNECSPGAFVPIGDTQQCLQLFLVVTVYKVLAASSVGQTSSRAQDAPPQQQISPPKTWVVPGWRNPGL